MTHGVGDSCGELFLKQGRPDFPLKGCAILCNTTYRVSNSRQELRIETVKRSCPRLFGFRHAEELVFSEIKVMENACYSKAVRVELYSSFSPCDRCCGLIEEFLSRRPGCKISIAFTCVYKDYDQRQRSALNSLRKNKSVIRLDVFGEKDWEVLQEMDLVTLTPQQQRVMRLWDEYWRKILDDILGWQRVVKVMSPTWVLYKPESAAIYSDNADLRTDAVRAFQRRINAYQEAGFPSQAELEEMDRKVRAAIKRRNEEDQLPFVALAFVLLFFLWLIFF